jgi:hypothetical protein
MHRAEESKESIRLDVHHRLVRSIGSDPSAGVTLGVTRKSAEQLPPILCDTARFHRKITEQARVAGRVGFEFES